MKNLILIPIIAGLFFLGLLSCGSYDKGISQKGRVRELKDTVGFAQFPWQIDSIMSRISRKGWRRAEGAGWKFAICPHDDYTYVGKLYPELLQNIKAPNIVLLGVAHEAAAMGVEDSLIFDSFSYWKGPWSNIPVSSAREDIFSFLKNKYAVVNDSLQSVEHSVESMIPFLQYFNKNISIVSILVPAMTTENMEECGKALAAAIRAVADKKRWKWGIDYAIVVTTDAVHYGNEDWGGADRAYYGCDEQGNIKAREHEYEIIDSCLKGNLALPKIRLFSKYTLNPDNFREYKWTWCGRYCVPVALYTAYYLNDNKPLWGELTGYSTSITSEPVFVDDIRMGCTAIATNCHWVGYASMGYR